MALSNSDQNILQEIVDTNGNCLDAKRCVKCPFRASCLPEFLTEDPLSQEQRFGRALDVLTHNSLIDGDLTVEEVQSEYTWEER